MVGWLRWEVFWRAVRRLAPGVGVVDVFLGATGAWEGDLLVIECEGGIEVRAYHDCGCLLCGFGWYCGVVVLSGGQVRESFNANAGATW